MKLEKLRNNFFQLLNFQNETNGIKFVLYHGLNQIGMDAIELKKNILIHQCKKTNCYEYVEKSSICKKHLVIYNY